MRDHTGRTNAVDRQQVPEEPDASTDAAPSQGRIADTTPAETSGGVDRVAYADPVADGMDPTTPGKPTE
jgi:hypothetical protein